ncbi:MAG: hypothetical protein JXA83_09820 [Acidimicrobiales bacterium]|nr:hypothetical protein [Acidimicrobiales bacterium]
MDPMATAFLSEQHRARLLADAASVRVRRRRRDGSRRAARRLLTPVRPG